jgi:lysyl-tRNA synthetase class 1
MNFDAAKSWPFVEARKLVERYKNNPPKKGYVLFETGYGPSGLPHIGTFGEVSRTTMVRHAFQQISDIPTKLFCVSDDMDGLRKVPENLPNQKMIEENLGKPLTVVPDPFGTHESFGAHMNARLRQFLDHFGFEYEFKSATDLYKNGTFDATLLIALKRYEEIMKIMLPTLGAERQATYSPFLPISPKTGKVLYVPMKKVNPEKGTIIFDDEDGTETELPVTGGNCKLQWKPDFGMRWAALDVDFEMYGKDHLVNGKIYSAICKTLGGRPPEQFNYELFLDEKGEKISKSKGNGITIDQWLTYASSESLSNYMFAKPQTAKKLYFDVIPKNVDEYLTWVKKYNEAPPENRDADNPAYHVHSGKVPAVESDVTFALLLNLVSASNSEDKATLWGFISAHDANATPEKCPHLDQLVGYAVRYYHDFIKPNKKFRAPTDKERAAMVELAAELEKATTTNAQELQQIAYDIGMKHGFENLREWFGALYEVLLGAEQGPRMGSFIALYGVKETINLINSKL